MHRIRVLRPAEGVFAFYEGRLEGHRFAEAGNWVDDGALSLGIASYAVVSGPEALIYDTHVSVDRARFIRETLGAAGVERFTVLLSHWHLDHVAGSEAFADCEVIASERTAEILAGHRAPIESGELEGPPAIRPLILPTRTFADRLPLRIGGLDLELIQTDIHSDDATVIWWPARRLLLCGDTMEDPITYVDEPDSLETHLDNLQRLRQLDPERILPNHGDPGVIARGGYSSGLIGATEGYIRLLQRTRGDSALRGSSLRDLLDTDLDSDDLNYLAAYEPVHRENVETVLATG